MMPRYKLRTLILLAVGPPMLAGVWCILKTALTSNHDWAYTVVIHSGPPPWRDE
jgi:hypothetical protein